MTTDFTGLAKAKTTMQWASMGILPSQANAQAARDALKDAGLSLPVAQQVLGALDMGLTPFQQLCLDSVEQIEAAIQQSRQAVELRDRERFERGG